MELKDYLQIIKIEFKTIIIISLLVTFSTFLFSNLQPDRYETSLSLFLSKNKTQPTDEFKYDGYYALEASDSLSETIVQWVKSPELVHAVYQKAEVNGNFKNIKSYTKKFSAKKMSPQYVEVNFKTNNTGEAEKISTAIIQEVKQKVEQLEKDSNGEVAFLVSNKNPVIIKKQQNVIFNSILGFISGLILGIFFVFFKRYFSN